MLFRTCYCMNAEVDFLAAVLIVKAGIIETSIVLLFAQLVSDNRDINFCDFSVFMANKSNMD